MADVVYSVTDPNAHIIFGARLDPRYSNVYIAYRSTSHGICQRIIRVPSGEIEVTVIAAAFNQIEYTDNNDHNPDNPNNLHSAEKSLESSIEEEMNTFSNENKASFLRNTIISHADDTIQVKCSKHINRRLYN